MPTDDEIREQSRALVAIPPLPRHCDARQYRFMLAMFAPDPLPVGTLFLLSTGRWEHKRERTAMRHCMVAVPLAERSNTESAETCADPHTDATGDGWVPCSERLPRPFQIVIGYRDSGTQWIVARNMGMRDAAGREIKGITHWRPLPAAPKQDDVTDE